MSDSKILQIILDKITAVEKKVDAGFSEFRERFDKTDKRIDTIGLQIAALEDDAPTVDEFDVLEKRVTSLEQKKIYPPIP